MNEPTNNEVDAAVELHFSQPTRAAPEFDEMWRTANISSTSGRKASQQFWQVAGIAAVVMIMTALVLLRPNGLSISETANDLAINEQNELFQQLATSTYWTAPSDTLLKAQRPLQVWGMPALDWHADIINEEKL